MRSRACPSRESLVNLFEERVSEREGWRLLTHIVDCPECLAVFESIKEIRAESQGILRTLDGLDLQSREARRRLRRLASQEIRSLRKGRRLQRRKAFRRVGVPAAVAAAVLLAALFIGPALWKHRESSVERSPMAPEIDLLEPRGAVAASALTFRWTSRPEVRSYTVEIYDQSLEPVFQSGPLRSASLAVPPDVAAGMTRGRTYFWKIVGLLGDNLTVESEFAKFSLQK